MSDTNNNASVIEGLKLMVEWLEQHPNLPRLAPVRKYEWVDKKTDLLVFAQQMGSFNKEVDSRYFTLVKKFNAWVYIAVFIEREAICRKRVVWDCPDEGLLAMAQEIHESESVNPAVEEKQ